MDDLGTHCMQHTAHKQTAVAAGRVLLPAKQSNPARPHRLKQPSDRLLKRLRSRELVVQDTILGVIELLARGPATQHVAEEKVVDPVAR